MTTYTKMRVYIGLIMHVSCLPFSLHMITVSTQDEQDPIPSVQRVDHGHVIAAQSPGFLVLVLVLAARVLVPTHGDLQHRTTSTDS